jgi:hypothetical protein
MASHGEVAPQQSTGCGVQSSHCCVLSSHLYCVPGTGLGWSSPLSSASLLLTVYHEFTDEDSLMRLH